MNKYLLVEMGDGEEGIQLYTILGLIGEVSEEAIREKIEETKGVECFNIERDCNLREEKPWECRDFGKNKCVASYLLDGTYEHRLVVLELK